MSLPRIIAICGAPLAGKSTVAKVLADRFGYIFKDDKACLRAASRELYGLTASQVNTTSGKSEVVRMGNRLLTVRELMGELGRYHEASFGLNYFAEMALKDISARTEERFVFSSVRQGQGSFYRANGALVLEVQNPHARVEHDFDRYDKAAIDGVIFNHVGESAENIFRQLDSVLGTDVTSCPNLVTV